MNLGDPELEFIDPTPNVHSLFINFDKLFFWTKLSSRAVVRWSKRMYSCAGVCSYDRGGLCDIALSEPLLKLRPRKDLIETLLHEMIHAYLFITNRDLDRDGHGPNFKAHMHRINQSAGLNISIYHDFHDEVKLYQTHWWRCDGPCQKMRPYFGIVRRTMNKPPGPTDNWYECHNRTCGGTFVKIKEPENKTTATAKSKGDITKYITSTKTIKNNVPTKPVLKDSNSIPVKTKSNGASTHVITKKDPIFNPRADKDPPKVFSGTGHAIDSGKKRAKSIDVVETVRNIWANKKLPTTPNAALNRNKAADISATLNNTKKQKADFPLNSPPSKMKKIDDYFKATATSMLKDLYGQDFIITQSCKDQKITAVAVKSDPPTTKSISETNGTQSKNKSVISFNLVDCPVCNAKISSQDINRHLDECLNKAVIETLSKNEEILISRSTTTENTIANNNVVTDFDERIRKVKIPKQFSLPTEQISTDKKFNTAIMKIKTEVKSENVDYFDSNDVNRVKEIVKKINYDKQAQTSDKFIIPKEEKADNVHFGQLQSFLDDAACKIENPRVKIEPGTSQDAVVFVGLICACCGNKINKPIEEHLEECLAFFTNTATAPEEGASTSFANKTIVVDTDDDDDIFDESQTLNATGTKSPCPCCLQMIEQTEMNTHLDFCLS